MVEGLLVPGTVSHSHLKAKKAQEGPFLLLQFKIKI